MTNVPELLTPHEVADVLKVSYEKALDLIRFGGLPSMRVGRQYRVKASDLVAFINRGGKSV